MLDVPCVFLLQRVLHVISWFCIPIICLSFFLKIFCWSQIPKIIFLRIHVLYFLIHWFPDESLVVWIKIPPIGSCIWILSHTEKTLVERIKGIKRCGFFFFQLFLWSRWGLVGWSVIFGINTEISKAHSKPIFFFLSVD